MIVLPGLDRGGTETQLLAVLPRLRSTEFEFEIVTFNKTGVLEPEFRAEGITIVNLWSQAMLLRWLPGPCLAVLLGFKLAWYMVARRPDLVHSFLPLAGIVAGLAVRLSRTKRLVTSRRNRNHYQRRHQVAGAIERWINARVLGVCANSLAVASDLKSEGVSPQKIALIYNGVACRKAMDVDRSAARIALGLAPDVLVMTCVANLIGYKGHGDLLESLERAHSTLPVNWRLLLIGRDDGMGHRLRNQANRAGLSENINFLGEQDNVEKFLQVADFGILASHEEGFSNSVLEGMAAGLPMVVTDVGGNSEAVLDEACGLVVPSRNPEALANGILRLAHDDDLRARFGAAALERAQTRFSLERAADNLAELYRSLLSGQGVPTHLNPRFGTGK